MTGWQFLHILLILLPLCIARYNTITPTSGNAEVYPGLSIKILGRRIQVYMKSPKLENNTSVIGSKDPGLTLPVWSLTRGVIFVIRFVTRELQWISPESKGVKPMETGLYQQNFYVVYFLHYRNWFSSKVSLTWNLHL